MKHTRIRGSTRRALAALGLGVVVVAGAVLSGGRTPASAVTAGTLDVFPVNTTVASGAQFTVAIHQTSPVTMAGAQADLTFDQTKLQVVALSRGAAYPADAGGGYPCSPSCGSLAAGVFPQTIAQAIAAANLSGTLQNAAVAYGTAGGEPIVPSGEQEALIVTMQATGAAPADVAMGLPNSLVPPPTAELVGSNGASLAVTTHGGTVHIRAATATMSVVPASLNVNEGAGAPFTVHIHQNAAVAGSGAQTDLVFDPALLQVVSLGRGAAYPSTVVANPCSPACGNLTASPDIATAIANANKTGVLQGAAAYYFTASGEPSVPAGDQDAMVVTMVATPVAVDTPTVLTLQNEEITDALGNSLVVDPPTGSALVEHGFINPGAGLPCVQDFVGDQNHDGYADSDQATPASAPTCTGAYPPSGGLGQVPSAPCAGRLYAANGGNVAQDVAARKAHSDVDHSGKVQLADLIIVAGKYNQTVTGPNDMRARLNVNGNSKVDLADLIIIAGVYNQIVPPC